MRASATRSFVESMTEPIGAPRPLERQTLMVSKCFPYSENETPDATWAFQMRAPSRCIAMPRAWAADESFAISSIGCTVPPPKLWVFSTAITLVDTKYGPAFSWAMARASSALSSPSVEGHVRVVIPLNVAAAPSSARTICERVSTSSSSPGLTNVRIAN